MKLFVAFICTFLLFSFTHAQNCSGYYYLANGTVEMIPYDKKEKKSGKITYTISNVNQSGTTTHASFASEMKDEKGDGKFKANHWRSFRNRHTG